MRQIKKIIRGVAKAFGVLRIYHFFLAWGTSAIYGHPSRKIKVVGVTGTKGKSTVVELLNSILTSAGEMVVLSSSNRFQVGEKSWDNNTGNTMPGRGKIQKLLRDGVKAGCSYGIVEVVSEGIVQHRNKFIDFDIAVFIGLHPEHIESHGSLEKYREAKLSFFRDVKKHSKKKNKKFVLNKNNEHGKYFAEIAGDDAVFYGTYGGPLTIAGDFNRENAAAAVEVARIFGISEDVIEKALQKFPGVPGRMEFIQEEPFRVVVDYAHTPDSLEIVYRNLKSGGGGLICVLGSAGGGRDKWKRPKLGKIASENCREIILTDEDPFDEDPVQILKEIKSGISNSKIQTSNVYEILDRKEAIRKAVELARDGDTVIVTGKGSEKYIRVRNGKRIPWSDRNAVLETLDKK